MGAIVIVWIGLAVVGCGGRDGDRSRGDSGPEPPGDAGDVEDARATPDGGGGLACDPGSLVWSDGPMLPAGRESLALVANGTTVFALGGWGSGAEGDIFVSDLAASGAPAAWHMAGIALPMPREHHGAVWLDDDDVVLVAGGDDGVTEVAGVYSMVIGAGDTTMRDVDAVAPGASLPEGRTSLDLVVAHDGATPYVYAIGGAELGGPPRAEVWFVGMEDTSWRTTRPLPVPLSFVTAVGLADRIFVVGGSSNTGPVSDIWHSTVGAGGELGPWEASTPLSGASFGHEVVALGGYLWVLGGLDASMVATDRVRAIAIESDHLGSTWTEATAMPVPRFGHAVTLLPDHDAFLVAGGLAEGRGGSPAATVWLGDPCP